MIRKMYLILLDFNKQLGRDNISAYAASSAFFIFLSLFPALLLLCMVLPYTSLTEADLMRIVTQITPDSIDTFVMDQISYLYNKSPAALSVTALITVWSAAKGVLALMNGLNAVNGLAENRNYIILRLWACFYTVIILAATICSMLIMVFGNVLVSMILTHFPKSAWFFELTMHFRFLFVWAVLTFVFSELYTWIPNRRMKWHYQLPGAAFAAVAWSVFSWGFSIYVDRVSAASVYGSLTTIIMTMLWLYFCMYIVLIGANMNRYFKPAYKIFMKTRE